MYVDKYFESLEYMSTFERLCLSFQMRMECLGEESRCTVTCIVDLCLGLRDVLYVQGHPLLAGYVP